MEPSQKTLAQAIEEHQGKIVGFCVGWFLIVTIPSLIIVSSYNDECVDEYLINLETFLYVPSGIIIIFICIYGCSVNCSKMNIPCDGFIKIMNMISCILVLFFLNWGGIGFYIYCVEMDNECHQESISKMILSWCIIIYIGLLLLFSFIAYIICSNYNNNAGNLSQNENDPLIQSLV
mmetsp:Transcript_7549/g.6814  ORF Transcript_7549/g.6814 Transcript_7549/m.6814 type:complete len:177 (-) Transcript_7549:24-554(-)